MNIKTFKEQTIRCIKITTIHLNDQIYEIKNDKYQAVNHRISIDSRLELLKSYWYWTEWDRTLEDSITFTPISVLFYSSFLSIHRKIYFKCWVGQKAMWRRKNYIKFLKTNDRKASDIQQFLFDLNVWIVKQGVSFLNQATL